MPTEDERPLEAAMTGYLRLESKLGRTSHWVCSWATSATPSFSPTATAVAQASKPPQICAKLSDRRYERFSRVFRFLQIGSEHYCEHRST